MDPTPSRYFLFPHMILHERDYRHLSLLVPHLTLLQVLRCPVIPEWGQDHFSCMPTLAQQEQAEQIKLYLKGYQDFANLHGEESVLASMSHDWSEKQLSESRFAIQSELRGKKEPPPDPKDRLFLEAAVFMELAQDLDERELELEESYRQAENLEEGFREILGIADEDDLDEAVETLNPPLASDRAGVSFMLSRRIAFWFRIFKNPRPEALPVLVALSNDVIEELIDPLKTECDRIGKPLEVQRIPLATLPNLEMMETEAFSALIGDLRSSHVLTSYWDGLEDVLRKPLDAAPLEVLRERAEELDKRVQAYSPRLGASRKRQINLTLTCMEGCNHGDMWRCIDKIGHAVWSHSSEIQGPRSILLSL